MSAKALRELDLDHLDTTSAAAAPESHSHKSGCRSNLRPEMRVLHPLSVYCVSLVCFQLLLAEELFSLERLNKLIESEADPWLVPRARTDTANWTKWPLKHLFSTKRRGSNPALAWATPMENPSRPSRTRRHAHHYPHNAQLMRVGCVLGTCQVQNLSHRLYQLVGKNGRQDTSPINPRSPHSYG
nr:protein ADM2-like [Nerophis lumbriciformis]